MSFIDTLKRWAERKPSTSAITTSNKSNSKPNIHNQEATTSLDENSFTIIDKEGKDYGKGVDSVIGTHPLANSSDNISIPVTTRALENINSTSPYGTPSSTSTVSSLGPSGVSPKNSSSPSSHFSVNTNTKDASRWRTNLTLRSNNKLPATANDSFTCPICSVILYTKEEAPVIQHVDDCLSKALNTPLFPTSSNSNSSLPSISNQNHSGDSSYENKQETFSNLGNSPVTANPSTHSPTSHSPIRNNHNTLSSNASTSTTISTASTSSDDVLDETNPFVITCPYHACSKKMEAKDFYDHVLRTHQNATVQSFACPVCTLMGLSSFRPRKDTNLFRHVKQHHADLAQSSESVESSSRRRRHTTAFTSPAVSTPVPISLPTPTPNTSNSPKMKPVTTPVPSENLPEDILNMAKSLGSRYVVDTLRQETGSECTICYEEFKEGDTIARMDCFCIFHKHCIDKWFRKANKCPLHKD